MPLQYKLEVLPALKAAGYNTNRLRKEKLLAEGTIQKLRSGDAGSISCASLEQLCRLLHCQPGDLLKYEEERT